MRIALAIVALLLAAIAAATWRSYATDIALAKARVASGSQVVSTPCGPIEYATAGSGTTLLLVHGAGGGFDQSLQFGRRLLPAGVQIVAPSRFGYLRTPAPLDTSAEAQADAHACLLDALGLQRVAVLGASAGAPSAMQFCIRHPQRCSALVLLVPAAHSPAHAGQTMKVPPSLQFVAEHILTSDFALWALTKARPKLLVRSMFATPVEVFDNASASEQARALAALEAVQPVSQRAAGLMIDTRITSALPRYELERISAPTLLISLEDDLYGTFENARYTAQQVRGARFVAYPSGGHVWLGHDEEVWHEVAGFVAR
jgi:2-hydroxy-6-oxonona-2,4-dienedioate hydrolase